MTYKWSNKNHLKTLSVFGQDNLLIFKTKTEKAQVHLKNNNIDKVIFVGPNNKKTILSITDAKKVVVGESNFCRDVYHWLKPGGPAPIMRLGITIHRGEGTWSSLPHYFELSLEPGFEEVFFHLIKGGSGRAIQLGRGMWSNGDKVDDLWPVTDRQFSTVPMGYHPVVGEPGVHVSYIWVYLAKHSRWEKI
ncbi:MAG: 5-deoxy-glucuronate isomerase [Patescibacteria group bacterium]